LRALIIGCRGQDGRLLSEILSAHGYEVYGIHKPTNIDLEILHKLSPGKDSNLVEEHCVDFSKYQTTIEHLDSIKPNRIFHLGAVHGSSVDMQSFGKDKLNEMRDCHVEITNNLLQWISKNKSDSRLAVALTAQMYSGMNSSVIINEDSKVSPQNVYAQTKLESFDLIKRYRELNRVFAIGLVLFNHTSIYAKSNFLFKELAKQISEYKQNLRQKISVINADYEIDISDAREVCDAMRLSIEAETPKDYVISSGDLVSIRNIITGAAKILKMHINEDDIKSTGSRPQANKLVGDSGLIYKDLGWQSKIKSSELLASMVEYENLL